MRLLARKSNRLLTTITAQKSNQLLSVKKRSRKMSRSRPINVSVSVSSRTQNQTSPSRSRLELKAKRLGLVSRTSTSRLHPWIEITYYRIVKSYTASFHLSISGILLSEVPPDTYPRHYGECTFAHWPRWRPHP